MKYSLSFKIQRAFICNIVLYIIYGSSIKVWKNRKISIIHKRRKKKSVSFKTPPNLNLNLFLNITIPIFSFVFLFFNENQWFEKFINFWFTDRRTMVEKQIKYRRMQWLCKIVKRFIDPWVLKHGNISNIKQSEY